MLRPCCRSFVDVVCTGLDYAGARAKTARPEASVARRVAIDATIKMMHSKSTG